MFEMKQPGVHARRRMLRFVIPAVGLLLAVAGAALAQTAPGSEIKIDNFVFQPKTLQVKPGTTVTWVNHDDIPHSIVVANLQVHSHPMDTDGTFALKFDKPGVYNYICGLHPFMKGQVVVAP